jgi:hypothetical protein
MHASRSPLACAVILFIILFVSSAAADEPGEPDAEVNPHFSGKYCNVCHEGESPESIESQLRFGGDYVELCRCHGYTGSSYIHPVFIEPSEKKKKRIPDDFPLQDGKLSCITCHEIRRQCEDNPAMRQIKHADRRLYRDELMFLRGGPSRKRTDICFNCHDEKKYRKLDPHDQVMDDGKIDYEKCLYCHVERPDVNRATFESVELIGDLKTVCQRCHGKMVRHPAGVNHFRKPSGSIFQRLKKLEKDYGVILPLDDRGMLTCVTCHNPHERGVIPEDRPGSKGASEAYRHRIPGKMCRVCHGF